MSDIPIARLDVYDALNGERDYQDAKWGDHRRHSPEEWIVYMETYLDQAKVALTFSYGGETYAENKALHILRKVTALGVAALEQLGAPRR